MIGIGYRHHWAEWIDTDPKEVGCLEITAEHFYDHGLERLAALASRYPVFVHGLGLSLGTPGPLDPEALERFAEVVHVTNPSWISEHVAFTRTAEVDLGHLNPIAPTKESLAVLSDHAVELAARCKRPLIVENITSHLRLEGEFTETEFLNRLCEQADCGLLLDVTNLYINSMNHGFDPVGWLYELEPSKIVQLHVVGFGIRDGVWHDDHAAPIQEELLDLVRAVIEYAPVKAVIVERDANFPQAEEMASELEKLGSVIGGN